MAQAVCYTVAPLLFLSVALLCSVAQSQQFFRVGVTDPVVLSYLLSQPTLERHNLSNGIVLMNFTQLTFNDSLLLASSVPALTNFLGTQSLNAIISSYSVALAVATHSLNILYFIDSSIDFSTLEYQPHMFKYEIDYSELNQTLYDVTTSLQRNKFFILADSTASSAYFVSNLAGKPFMQKVLSNETSDAEIYSILVQNSMLLSGQTWVLLFGPENSILLERVLNQSAFAGLLKSTDTYFIPTLVDKQSFLRNFRQSDALIYTLRLQNMQRVSEQQLHHLYIDDCIKHLAVAINARLSLSRNTTLASVVNSVNITGQSGLFLYRQGRRYGMTLGVMAMLKTLPENDFFQLIGTWTQGIAEPFSRDFSKQISIANSIIRFAAIIEAPYVYYDREGRLTGLCIDIIELMRVALNFRYRILFVEDGSYGSLQANGSWNGIMGYLVENKADISANFLAKTAARLQYVDTSVDLLQSGSRILAKRVVHELDFFHVFYPFSWYVWLSILFSMFVLAATLWVSDKISPNVKGKSIFTMMESFFLVFSSFLMSKVETEPRRPSARLFTLLLWFSTLFYMTTYVSNLVAFFIKPDDQLPFSNIAELENATTYRYVLVRNSATYAAVARRWPSLIRRAEANWPEDLIQPSVAAAVQMVLNRDRYVYIGSAATIKYEKTKYCNLMLQGPIEEVVYETMLISRSYRFANQIRAFLGAHRYLDFPKLEQKYFSLNRCSDSVINPNDKKPLGFNYFAGIFALVGIGAILGFLYIFLQWMFRKFSEFLSRTRGKRLKYGRVYDAEIIKVVKEGVWIGIEGRRQFYFISNNSLRPDPKEVKNAKSLGLHPGENMKVQYFGKDEATQNRIFSRLFENNKWYVEQQNVPSDPESD